MNKFKEGQIVRHMGGDMFLLLREENKMYQYVQIFSKNKRVLCKGWFVFGSYPECYDILV